ncbi:hypothetical protein H0H92_012886 [Tricholoma furcatifolium]|nr:hypothetical protein H0H92_012886 [Tricholoma furcatifolium]
MLEAQHNNAWVTGGPKLVQEQALKRLQTLGWTAVRPALSVTVRGWIMRGYLQATLRLPGSSTQFIFDALQVLTWGARTWKNVAKIDRGAIFEATFIRGVKRLYMNILMETSTPQQGILEDIAQVAREILDEYLPPPTYEVDPGFASSFWIYPEADAHIVLGWYYLRKAAATRNDDEYIYLCKEAADEYVKGAKKYPIDDEHFVLFLKIGLEAHWFARSPLKVTLPIAEQVRLSAPAMKVIWEFSSAASFRDPGITQVLEFQKHFKAEVDAGRLTLEDIGIPDGIPARPKA